VVTSAKALGGATATLGPVRILGTPSGEGDGLSFAQGAGLTFSSDRFSTITRLDITRDYLNFSGGSVLQGESVVFRFAVTDNSPQSPIYLNQNPNKADIPEPASMFLLGSGLIASLFLRKRIARVGDSGSLAADAGKVRDVRVSIGIGGRVLR
jgi:hypothetical protein